MGSGWVIFVGLWFHLRSIIIFSSSERNSIHFSVLETVATSEKFIKIKDLENNSRARPFFLL
jgi:hypothetical protein